MRAFWAGLAAALLLALPAQAQNMSLRAPDWAARLVAADLLPTTGGRASLQAPGIELAVRVTIAPNLGGVARVIRYEAGGTEPPKLALRRFTGHPSAGWWLWGPDTPRITTPPASIRAEIQRLANSVMAVVSMGLNDTSGSCTTGDKVFIELYIAGRSSSLQRDCVAGDVIGQLTHTLSDLAGSRDEEELFNAGNAELLDVDRAFSARAQAGNWAQAVAQYAAPNAKILGDARAAWTPREAHVATRGDLGWTSGADAAGHAYVTVWTRDDAGDWKVAASGR